MKLPSPSTHKFPKSVGMNEQWDGKWRGIAGDKENQSEGLGLK